MGKVDVEKVKRDRANRQGGGDLLEIAEGDTNVYVCPPFRADDDVPYWEFRVHYDLGPKGKNMAICLEAAFNPILAHPSLKEQLEALGKSIDGGCAICEANDKAGEDKKPSSKWLWILAPISSRSDARQNFRPWPEVDKVGGLLTPYRVWNGLSDMFGSCGDITDPDNAVLGKIERKGKGQMTQWAVQADVETVRKPMRIPESLRAVIQETTQPGQVNDPYRILANMVRTRDQQLLLLTTDVDDDVETTDASAPAEAPPAGHKAPPVPGKQGAKSAPAKPAAPAAKPVPAPATKAAVPAVAKTATPVPAKVPGKPGPKPKAAANDEAALIAKHGAPPNCFKVDPDPAEKICRACHFKIPCAAAVGVPVPPDEVEDKATEVEESGADDSIIAASDAVAGSEYQMQDGVNAVCKGPAKGKIMFVGEGNKVYKLEITDQIGLLSGEAEEATPDAAPDDEQAALDELAKELDSIKKPAAKPKK